MDEIDENDRKNDSIFLPHESNPYTERIPCGYCLKENVFTRVYYNKKIPFASVFLCYNCGIDFVDKNEGWELITTKIRFLPQQQQQQ